MDCGIAGIYLKKPLEEYPTGGAAWYMYLMLIALQHRGQQSAGIATFNPAREYSKLNVHKDLGLVPEVFRGSKKEEFLKIMQRHTGRAAIGHVRYATSGVQNSDEEKWREEAQPFHRHHSHKRKHFALVWNGNLANHRELRRELEASDEYEMDTPVDTEVLMHYLSLGIKDELDRKSKFSIERVLRETTAKFDGSYSLGMLDVAGNLLFFRDPHTFMPLCWGENENFIAFASESRALNKIGIYRHQDIAGGEYILVDQSHQVQQEKFQEATPTPCFFQWMYFANPISTIDGLKVRHFREKVGEELVRGEPLKHDLDKSWVIVPVPETSIPIARKMAQILGIRCLEDALIKDRDIRAFIEKEEQRKILLAVKYNIDPDEIRGMNLLIIDDSIVRGDTSKKLMQLIREAANPKSIHLRSACPPIYFPCVYGVDFPTRNELIAPKYEVEELETKLAKVLEIDSVKYLSLSSLRKIFTEVKKESVCNACLTGDYPTQGGKKRLEEMLEV
ncbi:amidophosphoribosyltransferase [Candidatus Woesearchaeota archaeon]|nr:amidophosphoribosyltransferase [Candidatus Woesearchaeota archaeon]